MRNEDCVAFLRWCLPLMGLRWPGFRKVRGTVCKRVRRRIVELGLGDLEGYRAYLAAHEDEWRMLDAFCRIPISRFWRDRAVFAGLADEVLPRLATEAARSGRDTVTAWCAGCASGEEAYSLRLAWLRHAAGIKPSTALEILATDADETMLARAKAGIYVAGSLKDLPEALLAEGFEMSANEFVVKGKYRAGITFRLEDIRQTMPDGPFDLILCRNLAFTYLEVPAQVSVLTGLRQRLRASGILVVGTHEVLPAEGADFEPWAPGLPVYRLSASCAGQDVPA